MTSLRIIMAQLDFLVGDIAGNTAKIIQHIVKARDELAGDVVVFPELAVTGYSPEDLLLRPGMIDRVEKALDKIAAATQGIDVILGHPHKTPQGLYNAASLLRGGKSIATHHKHHLPNVEVFDEKRYFVAGEGGEVVTLKDVPVVIAICEDIWRPQTALHAKAMGAQLLIVLNASPYHYQKVAQRRELLREQALRAGMPIIYVNTVGGQDELVFDGGSFAVDALGEITVQAPFFMEEMRAIDIKVDKAAVIQAQPLIALPAQEESIYRALVLGLRDYVNKNKFNSVVIGLSGGVDSALTAAIAVDALGAARVQGVLMPSRYTRTMSNEDAILQCEQLNIAYQILPIEQVFNAYLETLAPAFKDCPTDTTEENLQARARGMLLMALSNKFGHLVLSTGNKSEMSVGYCTLYGDMVGGFCVLKDVWKTMVYRLCAYRNSLSLAIPERMINRAPSAELAPDQQDQDSLPPYDVLDQILYYYIEQDEEWADIVARGFEPQMVKRVLQLVDKNEYKRRQAPIGICLTTRAFGRNRRYPITSGYAITV